VFSAKGPSFPALARQALSSVEHGYDLLAPDFDNSPFRTPGRVLAAVEDAVRPLGPFRSGLDLCCGTGAGVGALRALCGERVTGVDFSAGMLARAAAAFPDAGDAPLVEWLRADVRRLPFRGEFDVVASFGAFGHFLPGERPGLFSGVRDALRADGLFVFPFPAPPRVGSLPYWALWGFDAGMRVRNALWRPPFVMYYRTFRLPGVLTDLAEAGFRTRLLPLPALGVRDDGSPRCAVVVARRVRGVAGGR
jgi:SAM-dependent methyltransferase